MRMTTAEVNAYLARTTKIEPSATNDAVVDESLLHNRIIAECKRRGWIYFHGSMALATARTVGEPDFTILADNGRFFLIECKSRTGKLSPEQLGMSVWA